MRLILVHSILSGCFVQIDDSNPASSEGMGAQYPRTSSDLRGTLRYCDLGFN